MMQQKFQIEISRVAGGPVEAAGLLDLLRVALGRGYWVNVVETTESVEDDTLMRCIEAGRTDDGKKILHCEVDE